MQGASTPQTKSAKKLAKLAKGGGETVRADSEAAEWALAPVPTPYVEAHGTAMTPHRQALFQVHPHVSAESCIALFLCPPVYQRSVCWPEYIVCVVAPPNTFHGSMNAMHPREGLATYW